MCELKTTEARSQKPAGFPQTYISPESGLLGGSCWGSKQIGSEEVVTMISKGSFPPQCISTLTSPVATAAANV